MRIFEGHDSPLLNPFPVKFKMKSDKCCCFCKHCTDVWWDYTNGPYMMFCELESDTMNLTMEHEYNLKCTCPYFEDENEG